MRNIIGLTVAGLLAVAGGAWAQTPPKPAFEVASVKPAAPLDMMKLAADVQAGKMPKIGAHVDGSRAEYTYLALRDLIATAYKVKPYQITGPEWLANQRFDIVAKLPDGASKDDVPQMLQALLEERFKMTVHRETKEHPVLALVVAKGGPKLQSSPEAAPIDEDAPLKPGEVKMDTPDGPVRMTTNKDGSGTMNMGKKGTLSFRMDGSRGGDVSNMSMHMEFSQVTMEGFADTLTQLSQQLNGGTGRQVKDMTGLKGNYQVALNIGLGDLMAMARASGVMDIPPGVGGAAPGANAASEPGGGSTLTDAVAALGLKLEQSKAQVEQLIVDHVEKTPTEN